MLPAMGRLRKKINQGYRHGYIPVCPPAKGVDHARVQLAIEWLWVHGLDFREVTRQQLDRLSRACLLYNGSTASVRYVFNPMVEVPDRFNPTRIPAFPDGVLAVRINACSGQYQWDRATLLDACIHAQMAFDLMAPVQVER